MSAVLEVSGLAKGFGGVRAVDGVSFTVGRGELVALIGPNGAGKTTTFNMLNGQLRPDAGSVRLAGEELAGRMPRFVWRRGVARTFQITATFPSMTVAGNVQTVLLSARRRLAACWPRASSLYRGEALDLLERVGMRGQAERPAGVLAYGDLKRLELAMALAGGPRLLLMDEPTAGMAPAERTALMALTAALVREEGLAVLFTEHDMDVVFGHAHRVLVLDRGRLIADGPPDRVRADPQVQAVYLGAGTAMLPAAPEQDAVEQGAPPLLEVAGLNAWYGRAHVLHDLEFAVAPGEVVALMGRNGAGKSTTLKALAGLAERCSGRIRFAGAAIAGAEPHVIGRLGLGTVPEDRRIFTDLTVIENLEVGRRPPRPGLPAWTPERLFALFPNLAEMRHRPGGRMSGGEQQMLSIARTLMGNPRLLLLDEPSEGLAPRIVELLAQAVAELKAAGLTILLSEQNLGFAAGVADRALVIETGRIVHRGRMRALLDDADLRRRYLSV